MASKSHPARLLSPSSNRRQFIGSGLAALVGSGGLTAGTVPSGSTGRQEGTAGATGEVDWREVRARFLLESGLVYLNNASLGMPPERVSSAVARYYRRISTHPVLGKLELLERIEQVVRPRLAAFAGADAEEVALTGNASGALRLIAAGIPMEPGDEVVTTSHEHPAGINPWRLRAKQQGIMVREIPIASPIRSKEDVLDPLSRAIGSRTRALFFCHVTRGGLLYPVRELCEMARRQGIVSAVDGAQALGMTPVDLHELGCDLYASSLHKWTLAPMGTGMLYVRRDFQDRFLAGRSASDSASARRFEPAGTFPAPLRAAVGEALEFIGEIGIERISARNRALSNYLKEEVVKIPKARLVSSTSEEVSSCGSTLFEVAEFGALDLRAALEGMGIGVDDHVRDGHDAVRVSTHFYNSTRDIDLLLAALTEIVSQGPRR